MKNYILISLLSFFAFYCFAQSSIPDSCLLLNLSFNATCIDESGRGNHGVGKDLTFGVDRFGIENATASFNGQSSFLEIEDSPELRLANTDFTISCWINEAEYNRGKGATIIGKRGRGKQNGWIVSALGVRNRRQGNLAYTLSGGGDPNVYCAHAETSLNEWHHIVLIYSYQSKQMKIYIDKELRGDIRCFPVSSTKANLPGVLPSPNPETKAVLSIGRDSALKKYYFKGLIDDIKIYSIAIDEIQILEL